MIKYLGSKRLLLPVIRGIIDHLPGEPQSVLDLFSGTSRVGHALKRPVNGRSYRVLANDHNAYAATLARCYVQADREDVLRHATQLVGEFNALARRTDLPDGYFTKVFCQESRYIQEKNGRRIDAIRDAILRKSLSPTLEAVMLVSLMEAADRVDSTTGVQMAYLKGWSPRSHNNLTLRVPDVLPRSPVGPCEAHQLNALAAAQSIEADVAYIDPPYNQHSYLGNYHVWESLVRWDKPATYGVACKREDVRERKSEFNSRARCKDAMHQVLAALRVRTAVVSFNDEGYISRDEMIDMLGRRFSGPDHVVVISQDFKRYVGAQIGIHNPQGEKVGTVGRLRNTEYIFVASELPLPNG